MERGCDEHAQTVKVSADAKETVKMCDKTDGPKAIKDEGSPGVQGVNHNHKT